MKTVNIIFCLSVLFTRFSFGEGDSQIHLSIYPNKYKDKNKPALTYSFDQHNSGDIEKLIILDKSIAEEGDHRYNQPLKHQPDAGVSVDYIEEHPIGHLTFSHENKTYTIRFNQDGVPIVPPLQKSINSSTVHAFQSILVPYLLKSIYPLSE
jgi:hypothetical protein